MAAGLEMRKLLPITLEKITLPLFTSDNQLEIDGSRILTGLLPAKLAYTYASYEKYGFILVLVLAFTGVLSMIISPIIRFANTLLL